MLLASGECGGRDDEGGHGGQSSDMCQEVVGDARGGGGIELGFISCVEEDL
jgi:hypothetical protein